MRTFYKMVITKRAAVSGIFCLLDVSATWSEDSGEGI
jgi:hypothetical protein